MRFRFFDTDAHIEIPSPTFLLIFSLVFLVAYPYFGGRFFGKTMPFDKAVDQGLKEWKDIWRKHEKGKVKKEVYRVNGDPDGEPCMDGWIHPTVSCEKVTITKDMSEKWPPPPETVRVPGLIDDYILSGDIIGFRFGPLEIPRNYTDKAYLLYQDSFWGAFFLSVFIGRFFSLILHGMNCSLLDILSRRNDNQLTYS